MFPSKFYKFILSNIGDFDDEKMTHRNYSRSTFIKPTHFMIFFVFRETSKLVGNT